jgi:hypothetical protein
MPRNTTPPTAIITRMARVMAERAAATGACTEGDLKAAGFAEVEIARHADAARAQARRRIIRQAA